MQMDEALAERVQAIQARLTQAAMPRWGRVPTLIAVSKTVPPERVNALKAVGLTHLGENRVQEILQKRPYLDSAFDIDLIGRLQRNKVKYIIDQVAMIQSLDSDALAQEIDRRAQQHALCMPVLIQVNIGQEPQKGGVPPEETIAFARRCAALPGLSVRGLMAVMPDLDDDEALCPYFTRMRTLFETLRAEAIAHTAIDELSMGMSGDYELAAQEGATHVRVGSAIFGARAPMQKH